MGWRRSTEHYLIIIFWVVLKNSWHGDQLQKERRPLRSVLWAIAAPWLFSFSACCCAWDLCSATWASLGQTSAVKQLNIVLKERGVHCWLSNCEVPRPRGCKIKRTQIKLLCLTAGMRCWCCLVFSTCSVMDYVQTSPFWSHLSKGHGKW